MPDAPLRVGHDAPGAAPLRVGHDAPGAAPLRVGHIEFLNCLPLYWGLQDSGALTRLDLRPDTPERLSDALVAGDLDVSPVSVVAALHAADDLLLLPDLAVGSDGPVTSVLLASRRPLDALDDDALVGLTTTSRTSVVLARLLLAERGVHPRTVDVAPARAAALDGLDAAVVIGDPALRLALDPPPGTHVADLAGAWQRLTGLPFVFAVWAVRAAVTRERPDDVAAVHAAFLDSRRRAAASPDAVARAAAAASGLPAAALRDYYDRLDLHLGDRQRAGLEAFADRAAAAGLVPAGAAARLRPWDSPDVTASTADETRSRS